MKTFARLIRRYVLATAAVVLVAAALCLGAVAYIGLHYGNVEQDRTGIETLAGALTQTAGGLPPHGQPPCGCRTACTARLCQ